MEDFELDYDVQEVRFSEKFVYKVMTIANEALPLEMLLDLETRKEEISGQRLWEGSLLLCNYLLEASRCKPGDERAELNVEGKAALELGAGTGVVSMLVHGLGASTVVATDGDERCVTMADKNFRDNGLPPEEVFAGVLRWGDAGSTKEFCRKFAGWNGAAPADSSAPCYGESSEEAPLCSGTTPDVTLNVPETSEAVVDTLAQTRAAQDNVLPIVGELGTSDTSKTSPNILSREPRSSFKLVLAGDVLYKHSLIAPFLVTVDEMMAPDGCMLLCHVPRAGVTYEMVEEFLRRTGFAFRVLSKSSVHSEPAEDGDVGGVEVCIDDARRARLYLVTREIH